MAVILLDVLLTRIQRHAEKEYPAECCGLLIGGIEGESRSVLDIRELKNASETSRGQRYQISPLDLLQADNLARNTGLEILGAYHSHPDHSPRPSRVDRDQAIMNFLYIILAVGNGKTEEIGCWLVKNFHEDFVREDLLILDHIDSHL
jgi:proteasome lid subunit RPN8/RPN11